MNDKIVNLQKIARNIRIKTVKMLYEIGMEYKGHPGPALSIADILACLYFEVLNIDPTDPSLKDRDRFILSKGHACPSLYAALSMKGYFEESHLNTFRHAGSILQGHPDMKKTPGIDMTAGSLGHGLGAGIGMSIAAKIDKLSYHTYVLAGDGELQEGLIWESAMAAGHFGLGNLTLVIDRNRWQSCNAVDCIIDIEPLKDKLTSFGFNTIEIDGHDMEKIIEALKTKTKDAPTAIIAHTVKGKGVSFMEEDNSWHQRPITEEEYNMAMSELRTGEELW